MLIKVYIFSQNIEKCTLKWAYDFQLYIYNENSTWGRSEFWVDF